jgi:predicted CoA-binding protein
MVGDVETLLDARTVAVVGLSPDPDRDSHRVAAYLQRHGYRVVPVNPNVDTVLDETAYPDLASVPFDIDLVDVFRRPEHLAAIVDEAIDKGARGIWTQLGVVDHAAAERARAAGLVVGEDRCIMVEHRMRRRAQ